MKLSNFGSNYSMHALNFGTLWVASNMHICEQDLEIKSYIRGFTCKLRKVRGSNAGAIRACNSSLICMFWMVIWKINRDTQMPLPAFYYCYQVQLTMHKEKKGKGNKIRIIMSIGNWWTKYVINF